MHATLLLMFDVYCCLSDMRSRAFVTLSVHVQRG